MNSRVGINWAKIKVRYFTSKVNVTKAALFHRNVWQCQNLGFITVSLYFSKLNYTNKKDKDWKKIHLYKKKTIRETTLEIPPQLTLIFRCIAISLYFDIVNDDERSIYVTLLMQIFIFDNSYVFAGIMCWWTALWTSPVNGKQWYSVRDG